MTDFFERLASLAAASLPNFLTANFDYEIRGTWAGRRRRAIVLSERMCRTIGKLLGRKQLALMIANNTYYMENMAQLGETYQLLDDDSSRSK